MFGEETTRLIERLVCLKVIDSAWLQHLETMDHLREGIGLRGYAQKDPLVEYKAEAFRIFRQLQAGIDAEIAATIFKVQIQDQIPQEMVQTEITEGAKYAKSEGVSEAEEVKTKTRSDRRSVANARPNLKPMRKSKKKKKKRR